MQPTPDYADPQRIIVDIDVLPGPFTEAVAERILRQVVKELTDLGAEVTRVSVEIHGWLSSW